MNKSHLYQQGYTLLELMIAITLGLIVTAAATQLILGSFLTTKLQEASAQIQDKGLFGLNYILRDVQLLNFGNSNQYEIKKTTPRAGIVLTAGAGSTNLTATVNGLTDLTAIVTSSGHDSGMKTLKSDQLTIQFVAPTNMANCEGIDVRRGDLVVQRYFLREDNNSLALACDANTPTPTTIQVADPDNPGETVSQANPVNSNPTVINGLGGEGQVIIPQVDQFKVLIGGMNATGQLAYYDIDTFKTKADLRAVALKLSLLVRSDVAVPSSQIDPAANFRLFGVENTALTDQLDNTTNANKIPRQLYVATVAIRNGLGENPE